MAADSRAGVAMGTGGVNLAELVYLHMMRQRLLWRVVKRGAARTKCEPPLGYVRGQEARGGGEGYEQDQAQGQPSQHADKHEQPRFYLEKSKSTCRCLSPDGELYLGTLVSLRRCTRRCYIFYIYHREPEVELIHFPSLNI